MAIKIQVHISIKNEKLFWINDNYLLSLSEILKKIGLIFYIEVLKNLMDRFLKIFHCNLKNIVKVSKRQNNFKILDYGIKV